MGANFLRDHAGESIAIHGQRAAGLHPGGVGTGENQASHPAQLLLQESHGVLQAVSPQGVGAHQLGKVRRMVRRRHLLGLHLHQTHRNPSFRQLPGRFAARQAGAHYGYCFHGTPPSIYSVLASAFFRGALAAAVFFTAVFLAAGFFADFFSGAAASASFVSSAAASASAASTEAAGLRRYPR